jgi:2-hydroxychromene-2-carboxylate isomerase
VTVAELYYDLGSPYAYLAVQHAERVIGSAPELRPVLLGAIFAARGHGSWAHTDTRAESVAEVERRAAAYGLPPVRWPAGWPPNTLQAMRAAVGAGRAGATGKGPAPGGRPSW